jgi:putative ABC transport system permease protein
MRALDRKLVRDLLHIWPQALAIALVLASGVATLILAVGAYRSLDETRSAYYDRNRFADVFATVTRAPMALEARIREIPGVAIVETRISKLALLDIAGFGMPATARFLSLPDTGDQRLNRLYLRAGRLPQPGHVSEAVVNEAFAQAHGFTIGSTLSAILNGRKQQLRIVGIALSPEFVYALGPGDLMPDDRRFAVLWMSREALAALFDLNGAFNSIALRLVRGAQEVAVLDALDALTKRYGGSGAIGRKDQLSHAFLDAELTQLASMARVVPPIFLFVSAFLINMTLTRLIALEREQIGLLKALGYGRIAIGAHYVKLVLAIALVGIVLGFGLGTWFGRGLTRLYGDFFHFPFLIFRRDPDIYVMAAGISALAAVAGCVRAVWGALSLAPAVAMQPPAPPRYRRGWLERIGIMSHLSQMAVMAIRHLVRWPLRAAFTVLGIALGVALLVVALFSLDSVEHMIDVNFFVANRQDATLGFASERNIRVVRAVERLPGVMRSEPFRAVQVRLRNGHLERKLAIYGKPANQSLSRVIDSDLRAVPLPPNGLMVDQRVAELLKIGRGDIVEIELLEGRRGIVRVPVVDITSALTGDPALVRPRDERDSVLGVPLLDIVKSDFGLSAYMDMTALNELLDEGPIVTGVHISYDRRAEDALFQAIKSTPALSGIALQRISLEKFRETLAQNINIMVSVYVSLAAIVAFGVVYNSARIGLSEQARELASLRVLGFTRAEASRVLLIELVLLILAAQPLGWLLGYGFGWLTIKGFSSDLYRVQLVISSATYAKSSLVVMLAAAASALVVRRRIDRLDLISVLKTRD